jgi:plastocyanin
MKIFDFQLSSQISDKMNKSILFVFVITLLLLGCQAKVSAPAGAQPIEEQTNITQSNNSNMPEVPKEWEGKTIAEIMNVSGSNQSQSNQTLPINNTVSNTTTGNAYSVSKGTYIVEARKIEDSLQFFPRQINIKKGETIRFVNNLDYQNKQAKITLYSQQGIFRSPSLKFGEYFEYTFNQTGNFSYNCVPYQDFFMNGKISVTG